MPWFHAMILTGNTSELDYVGSASLLYSKKASLQGIFTIAVVTKINPSPNSLSVLIIGCYSFLDHEISLFEADGAKIFGEGFQRPIGTKRLTSWIMNTLELIRELRKYIIFLHLNSRCSCRRQRDVSDDTEKFDKSQTEKEWYFTLDCT